MIIAPEPKPQPMRPPQRHRFRQLRTWTAKRSQGAPWYENVPPVVRQSKVVSAAASTPTTSKTEQHRTPQAWLEEIEKLRAVGRHEDAERELAHFKEVYPNYFEIRDQAPTK